MLLYFIITIIIGVLVGSMIERYRWVNLTKNNKLKEVDGWVRIPYPPPF